jgi:hypothetical protein
MQAELVRVPYANVGCVKLPDEVTDDQAIMISDIFPTAWFGARLAEVDDGDTVAVLGAGPVGIFAAISAFLQGAGRVISVDRHSDRLDIAREQGAEVVDFDAEDPIDAIRELTGGIGPDRVIDAVGVDAEHVHAGPGAGRSETPEDEFGGRPGRPRPFSGLAGCALPTGRRPHRAPRSGALAAPSAPLAPRSRRARRRADSLRGERARTGACRCRSARRPGRAGSGSSTRCRRAFGLCNRYGLSNA